MQKNLVIVESPAKAKTIEKFLGTDYKVMSSYGHIRDLKTKEFSIDIAHNYTPEYAIPADKKKLVSELKARRRKQSGWHPMRTVRERLSLGIYRRCWIWIRSVRSVLSSMRSPRTPFCMRLRHLVPSISTW